jgi:hypothetical protein
MKESFSRVIGFFVYAPSNALVCSNKACLVAGSEAAMLEYLKESMPDSWNRNDIRKIRFGEILRGMDRGGSYAFDKEAYGRYYVQACKQGLSTFDADFEEANTNGQRFLLVEAAFSSQRLKQQPVGDIGMLLVSSQIDKTR